MNETIEIRGARQHFLKNLDLSIPRGKLVVITGPSGSGKSSLAFHTIYAEGQRRYVESLSSFARQFLAQLDKPDVDSISGLSPALALEQRGGGLNPRSTVASATEIYDYLRILWASMGVPHDEETGEEMQRTSAGQVVEALVSEAEGTRLVLLAPMVAEGVEVLEDLHRQGFVRVRIEGEMLELEEAQRHWPAGDVQPRVEVVIDRVVVREGSEARLADSVEMALRVCDAELRVLKQAVGEETWEEISFQTSYRNLRTGEVMEVLTPKHFSFYSPLGACEACGGQGVVQVVAWRELEEKTQVALREKFDLHGLANEVEWEKLLTEEWRNERKSPLRRELVKALEERVCVVCEGKRLKRKNLAVRLSHQTGHALGIQEFCDLPIEQARDWMGGLCVDREKQVIAEHLAGEIRKRLEFLIEIGLDYLTLARNSATLSGGEAQRVKLATQLGSGLSGVIYVLDEPSIGLHCSDTERLLGALRRLCDAGNSVFVVEHDEEMIRAADWVIELGPGAGPKGGKLLGCGETHSLQTPTGIWLREQLKTWGLRAQISRKEVDPNAPQLRIEGVRAHNLQNVDASFPVGHLIAVTGASGSGKSTLVLDVLHQAVQRMLMRPKSRETALPSYQRFLGGEWISRCVVADQIPIGKSPRSNPATFLGIFDKIRELFAQLPYARQRGFQASRFSFNQKGGRCERCEGAGKIRVEMHFLPDAWMECASCRGTRFNRETLEVTYKGHSIAQILAFTAEDAYPFFRAIPALERPLKALIDLGLGYLPLGQPSNELSGGEAQRLKLALELAKPTHDEKCLYLLDEPTTGLHHGEVFHLAKALETLRNQGHTVIVIEHHLDFIAACDWLIELGPRGGSNGGKIIATGTPPHIARIAKSPTGQALAKKTM